MSSLEETNDHVSRSFWLSLCIVLVCIAAVLRFSHLGDPDFGLDEILHVKAAEQLILGNPPVLPSGFLYDRGLPFTYLVALTGYLSDFNEYSLRVPSAIFGVGLVVLVYWLTTRWFSASAGFIAAFLTTFSPMTVSLSREVRMYTLFQVLFLFILFFFYEGFESSSQRLHSKSSASQIRNWVFAFRIRPFFLVLSAIIFLVTLKVHALVQPGVSGLLVYILLMSIVALFPWPFDGPLRLKYIGTCLLLVIGIVILGFIFSEKIEYLLSTTQAVPHWAKDRAESWSYYRWQLLDEYPIIFGSLSILLVFSFIKNLKLGLFLSLSFLVPLFLHSALFPQKTYRYILHVLPIMYMLAGFGLSEIFSLLRSAALRLNSQEVVPNKVWSLFVHGVLCVAILGTLGNMPWFMRTVKDYANDFRSPHVSDNQHHHWKNAVRYISQHQIEGDVIISGSPSQTSYYGASLPLYAMNDVRLRLNINANRKDEHGNLVDYASGALVLRNLEDFKQVVENNPSGWVITYLWRGERFWNYPDRPLPLTGTFPPEVIRYLQENYEREAVPGSPAIAIWRWNRTHDVNFSQE